MHVYTYGWLQVMVKPFVIRPAVQAQYYEVGQAGGHYSISSKECVRTKTGWCGGASLALTPCACCEVSQLLLPLLLPTYFTYYTCCVLTVFSSLSLFLPTQLRKPLDLWGMIKSPYGLMLGFMLFGIFVFPMLKVDPDEYREAMAQLRGEQGAGDQPQQSQQQQRIRDR